MYTDVWWMLIIFKVCFVDSILVMSCKIIMQISCFSLSPIVTSISTAHEQQNMTDVSSDETVPSSGWCANIHVHVLCKRILIFPTDLLEVLPNLIVNAFLNFELFIAAITIY